MKIITNRIKTDTKGSGDLVDITDDIVELLKASKLKNGNALIFNIGSTAAITTFEFEPGLVKDVQEMYEKIVPSDRHYHHDDTWGDANGYSHLRATLQGPSLAIPFENGELLLGQWQQIVLAEFDTRPRYRHIIVQFIGE